jgi:DNA-binding protein YbaB
MAMFGKAKEQLDFVKKAREIQKKMKEKMIITNSGAVTITMNGEMKIQKISIDKDDVNLDKIDVLEKDFKSAMESAVKQSQEFGANLMKDIGGIPGLS